MIYGNTDREKEIEEMVSGKLEVNHFRKREADREAKEQEIRDVLAAQDKVNQAVCESLEAVDENFSIIENHVVKLMEANRAHSRQWAVVSFLFFISVILNAVSLYLSIAGAKQ